MQRHPALGRAEGLQCKMIVLVERYKPQQNGGIERRIEVAEAGFLGTHTLARIQQHHQALVFGILVILAD